MNRRMCYRKSCDTHHKYSEQPEVPFQFFVMMIVLLILVVILSVTWIRHALLNGEECNGEKYINRDDQHKHDHTNCYVCLLFHTSVCLFLDSPLKYSSAIKTKSLTDDYYVSKLGPLYRVNSQYHNNL